MKLPASKWVADPPPSYAPAPAKGYKSEAAPICVIAAMMGWDLQPWQRRVLKAATQYKEGKDGKRHYRFREVLISVPRQSGKTTLVCALGIYRALLNPGCEIYFSAQSGLYASAAMKKLGSAWETHWDKDLKACFDFLRSNGSEGFQARNGSIFQRFTRGPEAMHSKSPRLVINDEIWTLNALEGADLVGGIRPAQSTFGDQAQIWHLSTMGTDKSEFLNDMVADGRENKRADLGYFEWSLAPGLDPTNPDLWGFHPALGNTQTLDTLKSDFLSLWERTPQEWERGYCNRSTKTLTGEYVPSSMWEGLEEAGDIPKDNPTLTFSVEVSRRGTAASIAAAWQRSDPNPGPSVTIVKQAPFTRWIIPALKALTSKFRAAPVYVDAAGPNRRLLEDFAEQGVRVQEVDLKQRLVADGDFFTAVRTGTLAHDHSPALEEARKGIMVKITNGLERIDRDKSANDPAAMIAASVAAWGASRDEKLAIYT